MSEPMPPAVAPEEAVAFTVERVRIDEADDQCLISGADDEEEPAGYFILECDGAGATIEVLGDALSQRDGVRAIEIGAHHLAVAFDPRSPIGRQMRELRIASREPIGPAVAVRLAAAFGPRLRLVP